MKPIRAIVLPLSMLLAPWAQGAPADPPPAAASPGTEVVIEANRANLEKLGKEIMSSEFRFFERYNQLNKKREYMVRCYDEAKVGSRFTRKYCVPQYQIDAEAAQAREFAANTSVGTSASSMSGGASSSRGVMGLGGNLLMGGEGLMARPNDGYAPTGGGRSAMSPFAAIEAARPAFKKNLIEVSTQSPELGQLLQQHAALVKRFEEMYYKVNGRPALNDRHPDTPAKPK